MRVMKPLVRDWRSGGMKGIRKAKAAKMYRTKKRLGKDDSMNDKTKKKQRSVPVMENEWAIAIPSM